jgi:hypothetical protein
MGASPLPLNLSRLNPDKFYAMNPSTGRPVANGWLFTYYAGTNTVRTAYLDRAGVNIAPNPVPLDAAGSCEIYLQGAYRIVVKDAANVEVFELDQVNSTIAEVPEGDPSALLAANNLSDLTDVPAARASLALVKQTSATDTTAGSILLVGAYGLGGEVPEVSAASALDNVAVTGWGRVATGNVATVNGPTGAGAGVVQTIVYTGSNAAQTYYPVAGSVAPPWSRMKVVNVWSAWTRGAGIYEEGGDASTGFWTRWANGRQDYHVPGFAMIYAGEIFRLKGSLTFSKAFSDINYSVSAMLRPSDATLGEGNINVSAAPFMDEIMAPVVGSKTVSGCSLSVYRRRSGTDFVTGNALTADVTITGRWYA